jgi:cytochrome P450
VLVDPRFRPGVFEMVKRAGGAEPGAARTLLGSEGEEHQSLRRAVMPWFTPRRIETLRERTATLAAELVGGVTDRGECELMADVAGPIPPTVFCWMVGCDPERGPELARQSAIALQVFSGDPSVMAEASAAIRDLGRFARELLDEKARAPGDDLTSALLGAVDGGLLTERDVRSLLTELLGASVENTTHSIGIAVWLLAAHPDQWALLAADDGLFGRAVEECARFEPVIRLGNHVNDADAELLGVGVPGGTLVTLYLASAHRDPAVYDDPDRFDVTRVPRQPQLEFGVGRHYCIGAALARMEIAEVLRAVVARWGAPRLEPGVRVRTAVDGVVERPPLAFRANPPRPPA